MRLLTAVALLGFIPASSASPRPEAPTGFDNKSNGLVDYATHHADQDKFDETEGIADHKAHAGSHVLLFGINPQPVHSWER
jgi:hypothetical protein